MPEPDPLSAGSPAQLLSGGPGHKPSQAKGSLRLEALAQAGSKVTDEASANEALGHALRLVVVALENFKLTCLADIELTARLLRMRT